MAGQLLGKATMLGPATQQPARAIHPAPDIPVRVQVAAAVAETGATTPKQMGAVMKAVQTKLAGRPADNAIISQLVKAKLTG